MPTEETLYPTKCTLVWEAHRWKINAYERTQRKVECNPGCIYVIDDGLDVLLAALVERMGQSGTLATNALKDEPLVLNRRAAVWRRGDDHMRASCK
jgi:hypothetical protein